jgi:hypothetical protein
MQMLVGSTITQLDFEESILARYSVSWKYISR